MKEAITSGADVNEVDAKHRMTPLLWAILRGDVDAVRLLLTSGANPNLTYHPNASPLWHAEDDFGLTEIAELLKAYGAKK
jgi:ankyrin repeat protein